jgi:hypothetical protein
VKPIRRVWMDVLYYLSLIVLLVMFNLWSWWPRPVAGFHLQGCLCDECMARGEEERAYDAP